MHDQLLGDAADDLAVRELVEAVDMTDDEARHVRPNAGDGHARGVWYPDLRAEPWQPRGQQTCPAL